MKIERNLIPLSTPSRPTDNKGRKLKGVKYLVIHETGNESKSAGALAHVKYETVGEGLANVASYHFVVDDMYVCQLLELDDRSIAAGGKNRVGAKIPLADHHSYLWNIEICVNKYKTDPKAHKKGVDNAIELCAILCHMQNKKPEEVHEFIATHTDFINPKYKTCPKHILADKVPYSIDEFKTKVAEKLEEVIANPNKFKLEY